MKKVMFGVLALALILVSAITLCSAEEEKNVTCYIGGVIEVDGEIDEIWESVEPIYVENLKTGEYMNDPSKTPQDYAQMQCKVLWDGDWTLYILYEVTDPIICQDGPEEWDRDSVEFFIDEDNERAGAFDSNSTQWRIMAIEQEQGYLNPKVPFQAVKMTAKGYVVEIAYDFAEVDLVDGHVIGFDLQVNDDAEGNGKRHACLGWSDTDDSASSDNTVWGTLTFSTQRVDGSGDETEAGDTTEEATTAETEPVTGAPTEPVTDAPTDPVTDAPTEEPTEAPATSTEEPTEAAEGGCGATLSMSAAALMMLCGMGLILRKKEI